MFKLMLPTFLIALSIVGCGISEKSMAMENRSEQAIATTRCIVSTDSRSDFLKFLQNFADENAFAMRTGYPGPSKEHTTVQMWREDIKVIVVNPFSPDEFRISFYENGNANSEEAIMALNMRLRRQLSAMKGIQMVERAD